MLYTLNTDNSWIISCRTGIFLANYIQKYKKYVLSLNLLINKYI